MLVHKSFKERLAFFLANLLDLYTGCVGFDFFNIPVGVEDNDWLSLLDAEILNHAHALLFVQVLY
jgi:hypothetical protein